MSERASESGSTARPRMRPASASDGSPVSERASESGSTARPVRVLIADDHPMFRDGLAAVLRSGPGMELETTGILNGCRLLHGRPGAGSGS